MLFRAKWIKAVEKLYKFGFDVCIRLSPFIEKNIDTNIINNIKCNKILVEFLKVNHWVKKWFDINYDEYSLSYGGYNHLTLDKKIDLTDRITGFSQKSVGEYVNLHYEYFKDNVFLTRAGTRNSPTDLIQTLNAAPEANGVPFSFETEYVIVSTFGRVLYDFKDKYLASFTYRYDGSSRL